MELEDEGELSFTLPAQQASYHPGDEYNNNINSRYIITPQQKQSLEDEVADIQNNELEHYVLGQDNIDPTTTVHRLTLLSAGNGEEHRYNNLT
jgi:hypothetical protein